MRPRTLVAIGCVLLALATGRARAHDFWIDPSSFHPEPGSVLKLRLRVGARLVGDPLPRQEELIERFRVRGPGGESEVPGADGVDPAGFPSIGAAGSYLFEYESRGSYVELPADRFEGYLRDEGLERIVAIRARRGASSAPGRERFHRCAKALVVAGEPSGGATAAAGLTLELIPERDPSALAAGERLPVTLLFRGRPVEGALVALLATKGEGPSRTARTDRRGRAELTLPVSGPCLLKAVWMEPLAPGKDADWESWWASYAFEVRGAR